MDEPVMNRRGVVLRGAGAVGAVALAGVAAASPAVASGNGNRGASGSWLITHQDDPPGDQTSVMGVASFAEGVSSSTTTSPPPVHPARGPGLVRMTTGSRGRSGAVSRAKADPAVPDSL